MSKQFRQHGIRWLSGNHLFCAALVLSVTHGANAAVPPDLGLWLGLGAGQDSCGELLLAVEAEHKVRPPAFNARDAYYTPQFGQYLAFVDGFLSAANWYDSENRFAGQYTSHETRMRWLEKYCREHPLDSFVKAALELHRALGK